MNNFFTKRKTERINYKILKSIKANSVSTYRVAFKRYLFGWDILEKWNGHDGVESIYDTKSQAKQRIENEISGAYNKIANKVVKVIEVDED